jgi:hypothetical protein
MEKGKGKRERKGNGKEGKARQGKWREEFALARSIVVAADAGQDLATAKPYSSVADPVSLFFSRLYSISSRSISDPLLIPPCPGSHMSDLSDVSSPNALYRIHSATLISILAFFSPTSSHDMPDPASCVPLLPFLLPNVDPSQNLSSKTCFTHSPQRRQS